MENSSTAAVTFVAIKPVLVKKKEYYEKEYLRVVGEYLYNAKRVERDNAIRYKAKMDMCQELLTKFK
jgi:hypothetical protein